MTTNAAAAAAANALAWSECVNGFRTRQLILALEDGAAPGPGEANQAGDAKRGPIVENSKQAPPGQETAGSLVEPRSPAVSNGSQQCAKRKLIRRPCRRGPSAPSLSTTPTTPAAATASANGTRRLHHSLAAAGAAANNSVPGTPAPSSLRPAARKRRLEQIKLKQQQTASKSSVANAATTAATATTTTTTTTVTARSAVATNNNSPRTTIPARAPPTEGPDATTSSGRNKRR